jgi:DNA repair exonuclease SbcCD ATPase subunit
MKLVSITTKNFRSLPDDTYNLEQINCIYGHNGVGKSSFLDALWYLLTGNLVANAIRWGEDHVEVSGIIDDGQNTTIKRCHYLPDTYRINGEDVKSTSFVKEVNKHFAQMSVSGAVATVLPTSNWYFTRQGVSNDTLYEFFSTGKVENAKLRGTKELEAEMPDGTVLYMRKALPSKVTVDGKRVTAKALAELIEDRMGGNVKGLELVTSSKVMNAMQMTELSKYLINIIPVQIDFNQLESLANLSPEEANIFRPLFPAAPAPITLVDVQNVYKELFARRTALSREVEELKNRSVYTGPLPMLDASIVKAEFDKINQQLGAVSVIKKAHADYTRAVDERNKMISTLTQWESEYNSIPQVPAPSDEEWKGLVEKEAELRKAVEDAVRQVSMLQQASAPLLKMIEALDTTICPLCDTLVCNTDKTKCKADLEESIEKNRLLESELTEKYNRDRAALEEVLSKKDAFQNNKVLYDKRTTLFNRIENLRQSIPAVPTVPDPIPDEVMLNNKAGKYREYLRQINLYEECLKVEVQYAKRKEDHALLSSCVKKAEPKKGLLTNTILDYILSPFCNHVNDFLQDVHGDIEVAFRMDDDGLSLYCSPHGRSGYVRVDGLSTGEKMLVTFALMDMISSISNSRMLVFDCLENIDESSLRSLMNLLTKTNVVDRYDHIILSFVNHDSIVKMIGQYAMFMNVITL